jgi:hypothetical protein
MTKRNTAITPHLEEVEALALERSITYFTKEVDSDNNIHHLRYNSF